MQLFVVCECARIGDSFRRDVIFDHVHTPVVRKCDFQRLDLAILHESLAQLMQWPHVNN
jgi:hypothetical protein